MGQLVDGKWSAEWYDTSKSGGKFVRSVAAFRNWITADGSAGPSGVDSYKAESGRYHLYVSAACPWAHRTLVFRKLKQLENHISVDFVHPHMLDDGWTFEKDGIAKGDNLFRSQYLRDTYLRAKPDMTGRVTVPVLWDKKTGTIVSNESSEIIRMFNTAFNDLTGNTDDYYPEDLREKIDTLNERIYSDVNNGVYKSGFATSQAAYSEAVERLFETLDWLERHLSENRYLAGDQITEADWRLFTTLVRFDSVYVLHFKCNRNRIVDFPNLWAFTRELYQQDGIAETVNFDHIIRHYHYSHETINPSRIIPINPAINWNEPHDRD
jgi:putative glutathione S-transferase